ncbi:UvrD-helicase domain-containing protein, partial [Elusimicrobiota bacterium]
MNKPQQMAVEHTEGPVLIFAGAGSGKTMVITHRIAKLITGGIPPYNILAVTFTNKAAMEMNNRVKRLIGPVGMSVWISTFHSLALKILRYDGGKDFTVYDESDQLVAIKEVLKKLNLDPKKFAPAWIKEVISSSKNNLVDVESFMINAAAHSDSRRYILGNIYAEYQKILNKNGGYDFSDLLKNAIDLFKSDADILNKYQQRFKYILVDEYQDTNYAQYFLIKLLSPPDNNVCVVGDDDQCLVEGTQINCRNTLVPVEKLNKGDAVTGASGWGKTHSNNCDKISKRKYRGKVVRIITDSGKKLIVTPNHMLFGKLRPEAGKYYVYLMYKKSMGFRVGITQGIRSKRKSNNTVSGLLVRANQEKADKLWIIKSCSSLEEAAYLEQFYAFKYGIPTYVFHSKGRKMTLTQEKINSLFAGIDTHGRAKKLMEDELLDPLYPHHMAGGFADRHTDRKVINFTMFGEDRCAQLRPWHAHRIQLNTSNKILLKAVESKGFNTRSARKNTWRVETSRKDYDDGLEFIRELSQTGDVELVKKSRLTNGKSFYYLPASHIRRGMVVPVIKGNNIDEEIVKDIVIEEYNGFVYDVSVPDLRNYIANGFVVHNSVYSWRGADIRNILEFEKNYKSAKTFKLEQNYRSTQNILDAAHNVIKNNKSRKQKKLWTEKEKGEPVRWQEFLTNREEAMGVAAEITRLIEYDSYRPSDIAVFYRINAQSRSFEDVLRSAGINYRIVGGVKFYERKEIKDILAYMKVLVNPSDDISMTRIINVPPRGIGDKTVSNL